MSRKEAERNRKEPMLTPETPAAPRNTEEQLVRFLYRDYWNQERNHRPYQGVFHSLDDRPEWSFNDAMKQAMDTLGIVDGEEVEVIVRKTGCRPFGDRVWVWSKPHEYVPVEPDAYFNCTVNSQINLKQENKTLNNQKITKNATEQASIVTDGYTCMMDGWKPFWFEGHQAWGLINSPKEWNRIKKAYLNKDIGMSLDELLAAKRNEYSDKLYYGFRSECNGEDTLADYFKREGMQV